MKCIEDRDVVLELESKKTSQGVCQVWAGDTGSPGEKKMCFNNHPVLV